MPNPPAPLPERRITGNLGWIDALLDAVVVMGSDGVIRQWNGAAEKIFGWSAAVAIGSLFVDLCVPPHLRVAHIEGLRRYVETGEKRVIGERLELPALRSDGVTIAVELTITTARGGPDNAEFFVGFMREVTALRIAEEKAELGEQRLRAIVEHAPSIISLVSRDGSWESPGEAGTKLLGWPKGIDPEGGIFSLVHPDDLEYAVAIFEEVTSNARDSFDPATFRIRAADGSWHWFETTAHNMLDDPSVEAVVLHSRDVTESHESHRKALENAERLSAVVENLAGGVLVEDADRHIVVVNERFVELFQIPAPPSALVGADCRESAEQSKHLFADPESFIESTVNCLQNRVEVAEFELQMADGRVLERDYVPVFVGGHYDGHVWIYRDITGRREMETQRESLIAAEHDVRIAMEEQNQRLRELDQLKSDFVANVSHELRTPLTSIMGFTEILSDGAGGELNEEQREYLAIVTRSSQRMLRLIDDLLLLSRLETRSITIEVEPLDLAALLNESQLELSAGADSAGVTLNIATEDGPLFVGDRGRLRQVIDNLVNNALKFTPDGGEVTVEAFREEGSWILKVSDTGMGIPQADLDHLFEKFFRASNADPKRTPGTGLGLTITKAIVEAHRGTISVESTQGSGTTFSVRLPD
ncbi:PAS domain S-box [Actinobacteria bacterium IMCC26256]|nr:PAS domain S-box [Actinobacteria bacterium IMCC26256]